MLNMTRQQKIIALKLQLANAILAGEHENVIEELIQEINELMQ